MIYVIDSCTLINLFRNFYESRFPSLWAEFNKYVECGRIISVREVYQELKDRDDRLATWATLHRDIFHPPHVDEMVFVAEIFATSNFQWLVKKQARLQGTPVADPFVIAKAKAIAGCALSDEKSKGNAAKIPRVCAHFGVECVNLEGFMENENWSF